MASSALALVKRERPAAGDPRPDASRLGRPRGVPRVSARRRRPRAVPSWSDGALGRGRQGRRARDRRRRLRHEAVQPARAHGARQGAAAARLRPAPEAPQEIYERGGLRIDFDTYEVYLDGERVELSLREFELLRFFVKHPNRVYERAQLLELVWGPDTYVEPRTVDVHIRRLRRRIERDDSDPELIVTVRGVGYMFDERRLAS